MPVLSVSTPSTINRSLSPIPIRPPLYSRPFSFLLFSSLRFLSSFLPFFSSFLSFFPLFSFLFFPPPTLLVATRHYRRGLFHTLCIFIRLFSFSEDGDCRRSTFYCPSVPCRAAKHVKRIETREGNTGLDPVNTHLRGTNGGEYRSRLKNKLKDPSLVERSPSVPPILSLHPLFHVSQCLPSSALHPRSFDISSTRQGGQISRTRYLSFRRLRCRYGGRKGYAPGLIYPIPGVSSTLLLNGGSEGNNSSDNSKIFA